MNEIERLRDTIEQHRKQFPGRRHFPKGTWEQILSLAETRDVKKLAQKLGICPNNLRRRISKNKSPLGPSKKTQFLQLPPVTESAKTVTLQLPHNILLKIEL